MPAGIIHVIRLFLIFIPSIVCATLVAGEPVETIAWREGADFRTALSLSGGGTWSQARLGKALDDLSRVHRVCIIRDRRIDPETTLDYELRNVSLEALLRGMAEHLQVGVAFGDGWVYFGPRSTAEKLATLIELRKDELNALPVAARAGWNVKHAVVFPEASQPRELVAKCVAANKLIVEGLATIPHDLWPAAKWPKLTRFEELSLFLAQFDSTWSFSADGKTLRIIPIPNEVVLKRDYTLGNIDPTSQLKQLGLQGTIDRNGKTLTLTASAEEHRMLNDLLAGKQVKTTSVTAADQRFTLTLAIPVGKAVEGLAPKLGLTPKFDTAAIEKAGLSLDSMTKMSVDKFSREELIRALLQPAGLQGRVVGKELIVEPLPK